MSGTSQRSSSRRLKNLFRRREDADEKAQTIAITPNAPRGASSQQVNGADKARKSTSRSSLRNVAHGQYSPEVGEPKTPPQQRTEESYSTRAERTTATDLTTVGQDSPASMPEILADDLNRIHNADGDPLSHRDNTPQHTRNFSLPQVLDYPDSQGLDHINQGTSVDQSPPTSLAMSHGKMPPSPTNTTSMLNRPRPVSQGDNVQFAAHRNNPTVVVPIRQASLTASSTARKPLPQPPAPPFPLRHERRSIDQQSDQRPSLDNLHQDGSRRSIDRSSLDNQHQDGRRSIDKASDHRPSLDKPLPSVPSQTSHPSKGPVGDSHHSKVGGRDMDLDANRQAVTAQLRQAGLDKQIDLSNTVDTVVHERMAPAVTHETVRVDTHHIIEEVTTREFHNHHYYHRILPIVDVDVLPARHFVLVEGGYTEISEKEVPGRAVAQLNQHMKEMAVAMTPQSKPLHESRTFTARTFKGREGDYKETRAPEGHTRTETTWVHPPAVEEGGKLTGQTFPLYLGSPNPAENGLRAKLPPGGILGESAVLADEQRKQRIEHHGIRRKSVHTSGAGDP